MPRPFNVSSIDGDFMDRADEVRIVLDVMNQRGRLVLYGERRLGKTTIIRRAQAALSRKKEAARGHAIYIDMWASADEATVVNRIFQQLPSWWLTGARFTKLAGAFAGAIRLHATPEGVALSIDTTATGQTPIAFTDLVRRLDAFAEGDRRPLVLIFDEFQKAQDRVGVSGEALRGLAQECPNLGFIFSGSAYGTITRLLEPDQPFYGVPSLEVREINRIDLADWVRSRLDGFGMRLDEATARSLVDLADGVTSHVLELANQLYADVGKRTATLEDLIQARWNHARANESRIELLWDRMVTVRRSIMVAIAYGETLLHSARATSEFGLSGSKVTYHLDLLTEDGYVRISGPPRLTDPFMAEWIRRRAAPGMAFATPEAEEAAYPTGRPVD